MLVIIIIIIIIVVIIIIRRRRRRMELLRRAPRLRISHCSLEYAIYMAFRTTHDKNNDCIHRNSERTRK